MKVKVLIADDDRSSRMIIKRIISKVDCEVHEASNGKEALEIARKIQPDVMIVDWNMPVMDGEELSKRIRNDAKLKYTYIIMLTGKGDIDDEIRGLKAGADDYITKPAPQAEVLARLESGIRMRALHNEVGELTRRVALLEMAATVGHEINNPLNVIFLSLDLAKKSLKDGRYDRVEKGLAMITETAERLREIAKKFVELREPQRTSYIDSLNMIDIHRDGASKKEGDGK